MSLERFLAAKGRIQRDVDTQVALDRIIGYLGEPVLTIRQITELANAVGDSRHTEKHSKHLTRGKYCAAISLDARAVSDPPVSRLRIKMVYRAEAALRYLSTLAERDAEFPESERMVQFSLPVFFGDGSAQPLNTPQPAEAYGKGR